MENASKALLMAAGVLIAILIATLAVYLFRSMAENTEKTYRNLEASEISEFNQKFLNYDGRADLTIQDVATIVNLAIDNNKNETIPTTITVTVIGCNCPSGNSNWTERYKNSTNDILKEHILDNGKNFKCSVNISQQSTAVDSVTIIGI